MDESRLRKRAIVAILILRITERWQEPYYLHALEAMLSDQEIDRLCTVLGHPRYCPNNRPIPMGKCCKEHRIAKNPVILPVSALKEGQTGKILLINEKDPKHMEYMANIGIMPGVKILIASANPVIILRIGQSDMALGLNMARNVYVMVDYF